jgi:hypothetical protein
MVLSAKASQNPTHLIARGGSIPYSSNLAWAGNPAKDYERPQQDNVQLRRSPGAPAARLLGTRDL